MCIIKNLIIGNERTKVSRILRKQYKTRHINDNIREEYNWCSNVYKPAEKDKKGYVIDIHGGGLVAGRADQNRDFCMWLAEQGYEVYAIDYPLIPYVTFEKQLSYILKAINWVDWKNHDWDEKPKYLMGDSAGALLALFTLGLTSEDFEITADFDVDLRCLNIDWAGVWLQSPLIYTGRFDAIGLIMSNIYYGKGWKKKPFAKYILDPFAFLTHTIPENFILSSSYKDDMNKQAYEAVCERPGAKTFPLFMGSNEHDINILFPYEPDSKIVNENALKYLEDHTILNEDK